jgi:biotin-dependent carboxylase-like uncharacterized protein
VIEVIRAGALTTVQDLGRPGYAHLGVPRAGAVDEPALRLANRLVGNPEGAAALEITVSGCVVRVRHAAVLAVTGAPPRHVKVDGRAVDSHLALAVPAGAVVEIGAARAGLRSYLAVAGGFTVPAVLGSRSTDTLAGLGPPVVRDGDVLPVGSPAGPPPPVEVAPYPVPAGAVVLRVDFGPREDWFTPDALVTLTTATYRVSPLSNRVAARLAGPPLRRAVPDELPSEGVVLGAVQVPADGLPLVFLADHPTTGGYPVIAVVVADDLPLLAQARPGSEVRFSVVRR